MAHLSARYGGKDFDALEVVVDTARAAIEGIRSVSKKYCTTVALDLRNVIFYEVGLYSGGIEIDGDSRLHQIHDISATVQ